VINSSKRLNEGEMHSIMTVVIHFDGRVQGILSSLA
jgi:hypothetical protein